MQSNGNVLMSFNNKVFNFKLSCFCIIIIYRKLVIASGKMHLKVLYLVLTIERLDVAKSNHSSRSQGWKIGAPEIILHAVDVHLMNVRSIFCRFIILSNIRSFKLNTQSCMCFTATLILFNFRMQF